MKNLTKYSKFLSLILRHKPETINIRLDENGWANVDEIIQNSVSLKFTLELIETLVETNDKKRFQLSDDKKYIRANQGHSLQIDLKLKEQIPPDILLHGTSEKSLSLILEMGLNKMKRHHVHLTESIDVASNVGKRYGKLILLEVNSNQMQNDGYKFYKSENDVWLVDQVPSMYLRILDV